MSRASERMGTKSDWRRRDHPAYGVKARRNVRETVQRARAESEAAQKRRASQDAK